MSSPEKNIDEESLKKRVNNIQFDFSEKDWELFEKTSSEIEEKVILEYPVKKQKAVKIIFVLSIFLLLIYSIVTIFTTENSSLENQMKSDSSQVKKTPLAYDSIKDNTTSADIQNQKVVKSESQKDVEKKDKSKKDTLTNKSNPVVNDTLSDKNKDSKKKKKKRKKKKSQTEQTNP